MKVFLLTSTRADFGLLSNLIIEIKKNKKINLKVIVTGSHLSKKHGLSFKEIKKKKINVFKSIKISNNVALPKFLMNDFSYLSKKISFLIQKYKPNLFILLGDRYEVLSVALTAYISKIPIAHIHGGEITSGSLDDGFRHCISKLSSIHFVSHSSYKKRLIQLGENPKTVFNVGALGIENIFKTQFLSKNELEKKLKVKFKNKILSICLHPEITSSLTLKLVNETLFALEKHNDKSLIFTLPGTDQHNLIIFNKLYKFAKNRKNVHIYKSLGSRNYLSLLKISDGLIGNSSSGIIEMPTFRKPTINIGTRQEGRIQSQSIINVDINREEINRKINLIYQKKIKTNIRNPYKQNFTSKKIVSLINNLKVDNLSPKKFFDVYFKS